MDYAGPTRAGRPRASSHSSITTIALRLFRDNGFAHTSVEEIANAAGISRSTFFNYFASKADVMWGCQAHQLTMLEDRLRDDRAGDPFEVAALSLIDVTASVGPEEASSTADYRAVLEGSPELRLEAYAWSARRSEVIASYMATKLGLLESDLVPLSYAYALGGAVGAASVAFAYSSGRRLSEFMTESIMPVYGGYAASHGVLSRSAAPVERLRLSS